MKQFRPRYRHAAVALTAAALLMTGAGTAHADSLVPDADEDAIVVDHGNGLSADQAVGTTKSYDFSVLVANTGNATNDVFANAGDKVDVDVARSGAWLATDAGTPASLQFISYGDSKPGIITITVPCTGAGVTEHMRIDLSPIASNGKNLTGANALNYNITGTGTCATEPPAPVNHAPVVTVAHAAVSGHEGSTVTNSGTWSDPDAGDEVGLTASYGTVVKNADGTWDWSATPADGPNDSQTVTITASDGDKTATTTFDLTVNNVAPKLNTTLTGPVDCRVNASLAISFADAGVNDSPWAVKVNWGDGTTDTTFNATKQGDQAAQTHQFTKPGTYTVTTTVTDKDGGVDSVTNSITVQQTYSITFLAPVDGSMAGKHVLNTVKNGRVVPVKVSIFDKCALSNVTDPTKVVTLKTSLLNLAPSATDPLETYADAGASSAGTDRFRWSTDGFWIYNLDTKALGLMTGTNYRVDVYVAGVKATGDTWAELQPVR